MEEVQLWNQISEKIKAVSQTYEKGGTDFDIPFINKAGLIDYLYSRVVNTRETERETLLNTLREELDDFDKRGYANDSGGILNDYTNQIRSNLLSQNIQI